MKSKRWSTVSKSLKTNRCLFVSDFQIGSRHYRTLWCEHFRLTGLKISKMKPFDNSYSISIPKKLKKLIDKLSQEITKFENGKSANFSFLKLSPRTSPFQDAVYKTLRSTRAGETFSYGELAKKSGYPRAARAVGSLMANNPWPLIVPCHRVVKSQFSIHQSIKNLGEYSGPGGTYQKLIYLKSEGVNI
jgi:methylated-DNA-[protein]-cysteine S-methyltransferase